jgi:hypothetical protein
VVEEVVCRNGEWRGKEGGFGEKVCKMGHSDRTPASVKRKVSKQQEENNIQPVR